MTTESSPDDDLLDAIQLNLVTGVGPRLWQNLLAAFGSPTDILKQSLSELQRVSGIGPKVASAIRMSARVDAERECERCRELGIEIVLRDHAGYSPELGRIPDPPALLYRRGDWQPADALAVAIVGSRHSTTYGRRIAEQLAGGLARAGFTIVSGLARGIDAAAHRGALQAGGRTIAVCATGMNHVYPPEHQDLADEIARQGALLTESPLDQAPLPGLFPQRNRIISGLSVGVVLVEASRKSGALHTARHALEQNRELFAVPGQIDSEHSLGCLDLIRDGVTLIRGVDDVLAALGPLAQPVERAKNDVVHIPAELVLTDQERTILNLVGKDATAIDELVRSAGLETNRVLTTLTMLEMRRLLRRLPGNCVVRM
jgi:DNA processing protein